MHTPTPLDSLISVAGSQAALARLLGVQSYNVFDWTRAGRLPVYAVLLVESSKALRPFFPDARRDLRPGTPDSVYDRKASRAAFLTGLNRQKEYESGEQYKTERIHGLKRVIQEIEAAENVAQK